MRGGVSDPMLGLLTYDTWFDAFTAMHKATFPAAGSARGQDLLDALGGDRSTMRREIEGVADELYAEGIPTSGRMALAWLMMTCDPRQPASFHRVLGQAQFILDHTEGLDGDLEEMLQRRIKIWWRAADGEWCGRGAPSIFAIAAKQTKTEEDGMGVQSIDFTQTFEAIDRNKPIGARASIAEHRPGRPHVIAMPREGASKLNSYNMVFKDLIGAPLPLSIVRDVAGIRKQLHAEYPHATAAIDVLLRDLREGQPLKIKPTILSGPPGCGKSRLVRRIAALAAGAFVMRYDGASSSDGQFSGTSKGWTNTEASIPARAILYAKAANPVVMIDEIEKAATTHHGSLHSSLLAFLDPETSARYRDVSLDCQMDLSHISYVCTANLTGGLPSPLRDRFRIVKVPAPGLQHLPALAAQVMAEIARDDETRAHEAPLAADELANMARPWAEQKYSLRALQKIVEATLETRDECAMRH